MKIKKMTATFGKLSNETLELGEGLNIIQAPNEGGKSTWSAFLRAMFYGIPTKERDKQGFIAEKNRYQPWSGAAMEGRMELEWQGRDIVLRRSQNRTVPFGKFEAVDALTGEPIPALTGENAGEVLLGAPREVFERSAFVGQGAAAVDGAPALEKRISALVSSGEEDVSSSQVERRLREWLNRRRHNKTGLIPRLEEEVQELSGDLARQERAHRSAEESARALEELEREQTLLRQELDAHRYAAEESRRAAWEQAQGELAQARAQEEAIRAELGRHGETPDRETLRRAQEELSDIRALDRDVREAEERREAARVQASQAAEAAVDSCFPDMEPEEARRSAEQAVEELRQKQALREKLPAGTLIPGGALLAAGLVLMIAGAVLLPEYRAVCAAAGGALVVAAVTVTALRERVRRKRLDEERRSILSRYGAAGPEDILRRAEEYAARWDRAAEAREKLARAEDEQARLIAERERRKGRVLAQVRSFAPDVRDGATVSAALSRALLFREKLEQAVIRREGAEKLASRLPRPQERGEAPLVTPRYDAAYTAARLSAVEGEITRLASVQAMARGELKTLGDPAQARERREEAREELEERRREYDAISLALEGLDRANRALQERFAPGLNRRAGELMERLTGGKYDKVTLTREFEALAEEKGAMLPRRVLTLSQGTADQLYLAVRLAICELAMPGAEPAPLVLDDALANFDDRRMALALDTLRELAQRRQILLFTCHGREGEYLAEDASVRQVLLDG